MDLLSFKLLRHVGSSAVWTWQRQDTRALDECLIIGGTGVLIAAAILCVADLLLKRSAKQGTTAPDASGERKPLLSDDIEKAHHNHIDWLVIAIVCIGLSPLVNCLLVGEINDNVLLTMIGMHWGCMLVLPSLYLAAKSFEEGSLLASLTAYSDFFFKQRAQILQKSLRGCTLGFPLFLCVVVGYYLFRCGTYEWSLCLHSFEKPMEAYGFEGHSMPFRLLAAMYFTFWNPFIEELFWRVFLQRELALRVGLCLDEQSESSEDPPWKCLTGKILETFKGFGCTVRCSKEEVMVIRCHGAVRWGVSMMYASYHTWPMLLVFQDKWPVYEVIGFTFLVCLGRFFLLLIECPHFGFPAAYTLHAWIDLAFAVIVLCDLVALVKTGI